MRKLAKRAFIACIATVMFLSCAFPVFAKSGSQSSDTNYYYTVVQDTPKKGGGKSFVKIIRQEKPKPSKAIKPTEKTTNPTKAKQKKDKKTEKKKETYNGKFPDLVQHGREKIVQSALELAYPKGTSPSKYKYGVGKPKAAYRKAIKQVYPESSSWSAQCRAGASCDVGSGTVIRYSGVDKSMPRALSKQIPYLRKSKIWKKTSIKSSSSMKAGDVGIWSRYGPGAHIWIGIGGGKIVESNYVGKCYLHVDNDKYTSSHMKEWGVYRSQKEIPLQKGDKTKQVERLNKFLNWYGDYGLKGEKFGDKTLKAVKDFQKKEGLKVDGKFGAKSLRRAKAKYGGN